MTWPIYFAPNLHLGSAESGVALCLLWTPQERVLPHLSAADYALAGNLYSRDGISYMLRNLLARPTIHTLLLCGKDLTGSGAALHALFERGLDAQGRIAGDGSALHAELPRAAVELVRHNVRLVDARDTMRAEAIGRLLADVREPARPWAAPQQFPYHEPQAELLPAEETGFALHERTVREAWLRLLWNVLTFGPRSATAHSSDQCELLDVTTVISDEPGDPTLFSLAPWMPLHREQLGAIAPHGGYTGYLAQLIEPGHAATGVSYTYGDRLRRGAGEVDQLEAMVGELRAHGESRRAVATLWEPARDAGATNPPCLTLLQARLRAGRLHLTAYFRSHDIYRAWLMNAYGLRALQARIAKRIAEPAAGQLAPPLPAPVALGDLAIISHSAHVYAHDWDAARELLLHHYRPADPRLVRDPRGSFVIALEPDAIVVRHYTPGGQHLRTLRGATARVLGPQLTPFISDQNHAIYLGQELQKAELAMRMGCPEAYRQDRDLELPPR